MDGNDIDGSCKCRACLALPNHQIKCLWCGTCYFGFHGEYSYSNYDFDYEFDTGIGWFCPPCFQKLFANRTRLGCKPMDDDHKAVEAETAAPAWFTEFSRTLNERLAVMDTKINTNVDSLASEVLEIRTNVNDHVGAMSKKVDEVKNEMNNCNPSNTGMATNCGSPKRKWVKPNSAWTGFNAAVMSPVGTSFCAMKPAETQPCAEHGNHVKINLKKDPTPNSNLFKDLHDCRNEMPFFNTRKNTDGTVDIMFDSFDDADKAKVILSDKISGAIIGDPCPAKLKRYKLEGFQFEMSTAEVTDSIIEDNRYWLDLVKTADNVVCLRNDPLSEMRVLKVIQCKKGGFMAIVIMSSNMAASVGTRRLSIGHSICRTYDYVYHRRCYNCQQVGHIADKCENKTACSRCASGHSAVDCTSTVFKCVNCFINKQNDFNHPSYSEKCPYNAS